MANPPSQFISERFIQPTVDASVERSLSKQPVAYGSSVVQEQTLSQAIGQPHDADYALYKLNTDVSGLVHKWAGGITGPGWRITTMEDDVELTPRLEQEIQDITRWLKNPNPYKLFESMPLRGISPSSAPCASQWASSGSTQTSWY
jgi:hypothetical protein